MIAATEARVCPQRHPHEWCCGRCHAGDERAYVRCGECGHPYRTRWHLWFAYLREHVLAWWWEMHTVRWRQPSGLAPVFPRTRWWDLFDMRCWRPGRVFFCQCCTHDF